MPVYQYHCTDCGQFDRIMPMSMSRQSVTCPACEKSAARSIVAPYLASSSRNTIAAAARNERAQHEPKHSANRHSKHKPGCSCCSASSNTISSKSVKNAAGDTMFPGKRPWMISH